MCPRSHTAILRAPTSLVSAQAFLLPVIHESGQPCYSIIHATPFQVFRGTDQKKIKFCDFGTSAKLHTTLWSDAPLDLALPLPGKFPSETILLNVALDIP